MRSIALVNLPGAWTFVSDEDYPHLNHLRWFAHHCKPGYAYACVSHAGRRYHLHRLLAGRAGLVVDHINGNTLDNRRENLRSVSRSVNGRNIHRPARALSGERNIHKHARGFIVRARVNGVLHYGGLFSALPEAKEARDELLKRVHYSTEAA